MINILSPALSADMLRGSESQIDAIRTAAGLTQPQFDGLCMPLLRAYANRVQNLPFSRTVFSRPRGAWDCGLICATVAYQYASSVIFFPDIGAEERRVLERQCRYMCFIAALAACVSMVTGAARITAGDKEYHPLLSRQVLNEWLASNPDATFSWRPNTAALSSQACAAIAARFIPAGLLEDFDLRAVLMVFDAIALNAKLVGAESTLAKVVRESIKRVLDHYTEQEAQIFRSEGAAVAPDPHDASAIATRMAGHANPTIPVNPLAAQPSTVTTETAAAPQSQQPQETPGPVNQPPAAAQPPQPPTSPVPLTTASASPIQSPTAGAPMADPLVGADKVLVEWFAALKLHARFPDLAKHLVTTAEGIQVPINMLGLFGVSSPVIRHKMQEAGFIVRKSDDARGVILVPGLIQHFTARDADGAGAQTSNGGS